MDRELTSYDRRNLRLKRWLPGLAVVMFAGGGLVWAIGQLEPGVRRDQIRTGRVERGALEAVITGSGTVQPATEQVISSPIEARVIQVMKQPGAVLAQGETILKLDVTASELSLERLEGDLAQNQARQEELALELQETLFDLESQREIKSLDVEELEYLSRQRHELFSQGLVAESLVRQTETQVKRAAIELRALGNAAAKAREVHAARLSRLVAAGTTLERARQQAQDQLRRATMVAEKRGVLTAVLVEEGATVRRGQVVAHLADLDHFRVEAVVSDVHAGRLRSGQQARLPVSADELLEGRISRILPAIESGTVRFWVALDEPDHPALRANLRTDVLVVRSRKPDVLKLAKGPAIGGTGEREVFVVRGEIASRETIRLGLVGHRHYEVLDGLSEGDRVILSDVADYLHFEDLNLR